jgi:putative transposase
VFHTDDQRRLYLRLLEQYATEHGLAIRAYCLMSNHVHLIAIPSDRDSLARTLRPVHLRYSQKFNHEMGVNGVLWQGRFYSCLLEGDHYWTAVRYVERNPVRAGIVERAEEYPWSSAGWRCGLRRDSVPAALGPLDWPQWLWNMPQAEQRAEWSRWLASPEDQAAVDTLKKCTKSGWPASSKDGLSRLGEQLGIRVLPPRRGRPKK